MVKRKSSVDRPHSVRRHTIMPLFLHLAKPLIVSLVSVVLALGITWLIEPYTTVASPFLPFLAAAMVSAWWGGFAAAALATVLGAGIVEYYILAPVPDSQTSTIDAASLLMFVLEALMIGFATAHLARTRTSALHLHRRSLQALAEKQAALSRLVGELGFTTARERRQLASELHDYLAQLLAVARIKVAQAQKHASHTADIVQVLQETDDVLQSSVKYVRTLMAELSPPVLRDGGLIAALRWLSGQMPLHGLHVDVRVASDCEDVPLGEHEAVLLYQCVRELLINVVKHADVKHASISVHYEWRSLQIMIVDEGRGFEPSAVAQTLAGDHFGLASIADRITGMNGRFIIESAPGRGTSIRLAIPMPQLSNAAPSR